MKKRIFILLGSIFLFLIGCDNVNKLNTIQNYAKDNYVILYNESDWRPNPIEVEESINGTNKFLKETLKKDLNKNESNLKNVIENYKLYKIQCIGRIINGEKVIYLSFFIGNFDDVWKKRRLIIKDGGYFFWDVKYNTKLKEYSELFIHGEA